MQKGQCYYKGVTQLCTVKVKTLTVCITLPVVMTLEVENIINQLEQIKKTS